MSLSLSQYRHWLLETLLPLPVPAPGLGPVWIFESLADVLVKVVVNSRRKSLVQGFVCVSMFSCFLLFLVPLSLADTP